MSLLKNKRALIIGLANNRSIAYGIAKKMRAAGAELALTYQNDKLAGRVSAVAEELACRIVLPCDVAEDDSIGSLFTALSQDWDGFDILVHSVAFAPQNQLEGNFVDCIDREGFRVAHEISSYSFAALAKAAKPFMAQRQAALLTLSYIGAQYAIPNYNTMGLAKASLEANVRYLARSLGPEQIRVNGISAGPIRTLAASGVKNLKKMLDYQASVAPIGRNVSIEDVGNAATFLCSDMAQGITAEILHVDGGFHAMGMPNLSH